MPRFIDLRAGEGRAFVLAFSLLGLTIGGHTLVETARDTLFLTRLPPERLAYVYGTVALGTLIVTPLFARLVEWVGARSGLVATLLFSAFGVAWFRVQPPTASGAFGLYVFGGLMITLLVAQFWILVSSLFTAAQGRRLFGPLAASGVLGAVFGAFGSALLVRAENVQSLLSLAALAYVVAAFVATFLELDDDALVAAPITAMPAAGLSSALPRRWPREPLVWKIALIVALSTALSVVVDYVFKLRAVHVLQPSQLGSFFARYYLVLNAASLLLQVFVTGPLVARLGVRGVSLFSPAALVLGAGVASLSGAGLAASVGLRGLDGVLRNSVQRVGLELLWAPVDRQQKPHAKAFVDGIVARGAQALAALGLLGLSASGFSNVPALTFIAGVLAVLWLGASLRVQKPYLESFRTALGRGDLEREVGAGELDLTAVQALIEALARPEADDVIAAMNLLSERGRGGLIPALILYHDDPRVLERALDLFAASDRRDWFPLGERLLDHPLQSVRIAAARALALSGAEAALQRAVRHADPQVQARAALHLAQFADRALRDDPGIRRALEAEGAEGEALRLALIEALGAHPTPEAVAMLLDIGQESAFKGPVTRALAVAADEQAIDFLIQRLGSREDRSASRRGLVRIGKPAFDTILRLLADEQCPRRILLHLPLALAAFQSSEAIGVLLGLLTSTRHPGFVRYKALRGLEQLALATSLPIDRAPVVLEITRNATEYLSLFLLARPLRADPEARERNSLALVLGLLEDKLTQARDRLERLIQIAQRSDDVPRMFAALASPDRHERSRAAEYLDALARGWDRGPERNAERLALVWGEFSDAERARAAQAFVAASPGTTEAVLAQLARDVDPLLSSFAEHALRTRRVGAVLAPSSGPLDLLSVILPLGFRVGQ